MSGTSFIRSMIKACSRKRPCVEKANPDVRVIEKMEEVSRATAIKSANTVRETAERAIGRVIERHNQMMEQT